MLTFQRLPVLDEVLKAAGVGHKKPVKKIGLLSASAINNGVVSSVLV